MCIVCLFNRKNKCESYFRDYIAQSIENLADREELQYKISAITNKAAAQGMYGSGPMILELKDFTVRIFSDSLTDCISFLANMSGSTNFKIFCKKKKKYMQDYYDNYINELYSVVVTGVVEEARNGLGKDRELFLTKTNKEINFVKGQLKFKYMSLLDKLNAEAYKRFFDLIYAAVPTTFGSVVGFFLGRL